MSFAEPNENLTQGLTVMWHKAWPELLDVSAAVSGAVVGGFYTAFTLVVLPALDRTGPQSATRTMVAINEVAETRPFLSLFGFSALTSAASTVVALRQNDVTAAIGASLIVAGTLTTVAANVPMNRALRADSMPWSTFRRRWGRANALRALASITGAALLAAAKAA